MAKNKKPEVKAENKERNPIGRPTIYTKELGEKICKAIENTPRGLRWICANHSEFPTDETVRDWLRNDAFPDFSLQYARARQAQADLLADEVVDVSYEAKPDKFGRVEKAKLQVESLKWKAKVSKPKVYGDNVDKYLEPDKNDPAKVEKTTIGERVTNLIDLITKKKKISGEDK